MGLERRHRKELAITNAAVCVWMLASASCGSGGSASVSREEADPGKAETDIAADTLDAGHSAGDPTNGIGGSEGERVTAIPQRGGNAGASSEEDRNGGRGGDPDGAIDGQGGMGAGGTEVSEQGGSPAQGITNVSSEPQDAADEQVDPCAELSECQTRCSAQTAVCLEEIDDEEDAACFEECAAPLQTCLPPCTDAALSCGTTCQDANAECQSPCSDSRTECLHECTDANLQCQTECDNGDQPQECLDACEAIDRECRDSCSEVHGDCVQVCAENSTACAQECASDAARCNGPCSDELSECQSACPTPLCLGVAQECGAECEADGLILACADAG